MASGDVKKKRRKRKGESDSDEIRIDVQGSYTGISSYDEFDVPVQDQDDL